MFIFRIMKRLNEEDDLRVKRERTTDISTSFEKMILNLGVKYGQLRVILLYSLQNPLHSTYIQLQIHLKHEYMNTHIYRCTFYKSFVCKVVLGLLGLL